MHHPSRSPLSRTAGRRLFAAAAAVLLFLLSLLPPLAGRTLAGSSAELALTKSVSTAEVESGVPFEYVLSYKCASIVDDCTAPQVTDSLPPQVQYIPDSATSTIHIASIEFTPGAGATGGTLRWIFKDPLVAGSTGILRFQVLFPPGTVPGTIAQNTATFTASNATPVTTPPVTTTATGQFEMDAFKNGGPAVVGFPVTFNLQICSPDGTGGVRFTSVIMTDTLPPDAKFIDAQGTEGVDWEYTPAVAPNTGGTVRFLTLPTVEVGGCLTRQVTLQYDSVPATQQVNVLTATGVPEGCSNAAGLPAYCEGQTVRTLTVPHPFGVVEPSASVRVGKVATTQSSSGSEALSGETVTYTVGAINNGTLPLAGVVVTDVLPAAGFELVSLTAGGTVTQPVTVSYQINESGTWIPVAGSPFSTDAVISVAGLGLGSGQIVTRLRWEIGDRPVSSEPWRAAVVGRITAAPALPPLPPTTVINCATATVLEPGATDQTCNTIRLIAARAISRIAKSANRNTAQPLDFIDYRVTLRNEAAAQLALENPLIADFLPAQFVYVPGSAVFDSAASATGAPAPQLEVLNDFNGTGRTLLRWGWTGAPAYSLQPGAQLVVTYRVQVKEGTPPTEYLNQAALLDWSAPADPDDAERDQNSILLCSGDSVYVDTQDLDGDANTSEISCQSRLPVRIGIALAMDSEKFVRGQIDCATYGTPACEDGDYNKLGLTVPGGPVDYRLFITNTSNISVTNIVAIDLFPRIGDTGVVDLSARLSQWRPNLQAAVAGPAGIPLTIFYSTQDNPCRPELGVNPTGCTDAQWSTTVPADPTSVRAIKLDFCTYAGGQRTSDCLLLPRFGALKFDWPMVAPNGAPADASCSTPPEGAAFDPAANPACQIAWNSFGFTASEAKDVDGQPGNDADALTLLPAEPNKVGMRLAPSGGYAVGNLVWLDVPGLEKDGIQQSVEQSSAGVNGVRVELYNEAGALLGFRITGPDGTGQPGYYLFPQLAAGRYQVRFCLPAGYSPTLQNQGSDDTLDSDGSSSGSSDLCSYYATDVFDLPNSLTDANGADLSRDFGIWRPADYGDDPTQYPTQASGLPNPADAARHIIVPGLYLGALVDAEGDGQPVVQANGDDANGEIDDEDGVLFLTPLQPCRTARIQLTAETSNEPANYGAFFDWNGDGVFGPGEGFPGTIGTETKVVEIPVPCSAVDIVYTRFRLALVAAEVQAGTGTAFSGEVEDYVLAALGDRVWFDNDKNGLQGDVVLEPGAPGVVVTLYDSATQQPVLLEGQPLTATTNANGIYGFPNVPLTSYYVVFDLNTLPPDYVPTVPNAGDDTNDSDADADGRTSDTGQLAGGQRNLTLDMGIQSVTPTNEEPINEPDGGSKLYMPDVRQ